MIELCLPALRLDDKYLRVRPPAPGFKGKLMAGSGIQRPLKSIQQKSQSIYIPRASKRFDVIQG